MMHKVEADEQGRVKQNEVGQEDYHSRKGYRGAKTWRLEKKKKKHGVHVRELHVVLPYWIRGMYHQSDLGVGGWSWRIRERQ